MAAAFSFHVVGHAKPIFFRCVARTAASRSAKRFGAARSSSRFWCPSREPWGCRAAALTQELHEIVENPPSVVNLFHTRKPRRVTICCQGGPITNNNRRPPWPKSGSSPPSLHASEAGIAAILRPVVRIGRSLGQRGRGKKRQDYSSPADLGRHVGPYQFAARGRFVYFFM